MRSLDRIVALLLWCSSVWHRCAFNCDHTVHVNAGLSLCLDSPMWHQSMYGRAIKRLKIEFKLLLSANRKSYNALSIGATTDDLEWPWMSSFTQKSTSSALRAMSACGSWASCFIRIWTTTADCDLSDGCCYT